MRRAPLGGEEVGGRASALDMAVRLHGGGSMRFIANRLNEAFKPMALLFRRSVMAVSVNVQRRRFVLHARDEMRSGLGVGVWRIAKNQAGACSTARRPPQIAIGLTDECHWFRSKLREFEHVDEYLSTRERAVVYSLRVSHAGLVRRAPRC